MNCRKKYRSLFAGLIIEPQVEGIRPVPLDKGRVVGKTRHIGPVTHAGKERVLDIEFLRDCHIHVVGLLKYSLEVVVPEGCDVRYGIIPLWESDGMRPAPRGAVVKFSRYTVLP